MNAVRDAVDRVAERSVRVFERHLRRFTVITDGARGRFEKRMWREQWAAMFQRAALRERAIVEAAREIRVHQGPNDAGAQPWSDLWRRSARLIRGAHYRAWGTGFCANVAHRLGVRSVAAEPLRYAEAGPESLAECVGVRRHSADPKTIAEQVLGDLGWAARRRDGEGDIARLEAVLAEQLGAESGEILVHSEPLFRNRAAFVLGLTCTAARRRPFVLRIGNDDAGIGIDRILVDPIEIARLFDTGRTPASTSALDPVTTVDFLQAVAPRLTRDEAFRAIGLWEVGDEILRRSLSAHLTASGERLRFASGARGAATIVLTSPELGQVVKVVRDRPLCPEGLDRGTVIARMRGIGWTRRAGRIPDTRELEHLVLPRTAFEEDVLHELAASAGIDFELLDDGLVCLRLAFIQRRVAPLDRLLVDGRPAVVASAARDLGRALRDLASVDLFPGNPVASRFGVDSDGRVLLFSFDMLRPLGSCVFRSSGPVEAGGASASDLPFPVRADDVYPGQMVRFLLPRADARDAFLKEHGDLARAETWGGLQRARRGVGRAVTDA